MIPFKYRLLNVCFIVVVLYVLYDCATKVAAFHNAHLYFWQYLGLRLVSTLPIYIIGIVLVNYIAGTGLRVWHTSSSIEARRSKLSIKTDENVVGNITESIDMTPFTERLDYGQKMLGEALEKNNATNLANGKVVIPCLQGSLSDKKKTKLEHFWKHRGTFFVLGLILFVLGSAVTGWY